jgi:hypothetical protein
MVFAFLLPICVQSAAAQAFLFGLPPAKTGYPVFARFASLPSFNAQTPEKGSFHLLPEFAVSQVMTSGWSFDTGEATLIRYFDCETWSVDLAAEYGITDRVAIGGDLRAVFLSGGVMDGLIDFYHGLFGFPDMGRSKFPRNEVVLALDTNNGFSFRRSEASLLLADPQFHAAARIVESRAFDLTFRLALNVPAGLGAGITGTQGFQTSAGLYADALVFSRLRLWSALGGILPFESFLSPGPRPMVSARLSVLLETGKAVSPFVDFSLKGSPVETGLLTVKNGFIYDFFGIPEADMRFGFVWETGGGRYLAFAVQEDPFSSNSADVSFQVVYGFGLGNRRGQ